MMTRAEDRATVGTDPSADPGAKTEGRGGGSLGAPPVLPTPFGIGTKALNPSRRPPRARASMWSEFPEKSGQIFRNAQSVG